MNINYYAADGTIKSLGDNELAHYKYIKKIKTGNGYRYFYSQDEIDAYYKENKMQENRMAEKKMKDSNFNRNVKPIDSEYQRELSSNSKKNTWKSAEKKKIDDDGYGPAGTMSDRRKERFGRLTGKNEEANRKQAERRQADEETRKKMEKLNKMASDSKTHDKQYYRDLEDADNWGPYEKEKQKKKKEKAKKQKKAKETLKKAGKVWVQSQTGVNPDDLKPEKKKKKK